MNQIMAFLRRPIGGVPAWVWAVVIAGAIVGYAWITRSRDSGPTPGQAVFPYPDPYAPSDAGDVPGVPQTPAPPDREIDVSTNPAWIRYVTDKLVAEGLYGAVEVNNALTKVLAGIDVTEQEAAIYNLAVRRFGAPPDGAPPITVIRTPPPSPPPTPTPTPTPAPKPAPAPAPAPKPAPPKGTWVTMTKFPSQLSTLWGIAERYYGNGSQWGRIWNHPTNADLRKKRGNDYRKLQPGDRVWVPQ